MDRFILRYRGSGPRPAETVERIRGLPNVTVLDDSPRMLLVEGLEGELRSLIESLSDWVMAPERMVPLPDPRPKPRQAG